MLEIRDIQFFPDGRSIVDTMGGRRFKVLERGIQDGYNTAKVEFLHDDPVPESELQGKTLSRFLRVLVSITFLFHRFDQVT